MNVTFFLLDKKAQKIFIYFFKTTKNKKHDFDFFKASKTKKNINNYDFLQSNEVQKNMACFIRLNFC